MKILSVTGSLCGSDAASWRIYNIINLLQKRGHKVELIQYVRNPISNSHCNHEISFGGIQSSIKRVSRYNVYFKHLEELNKDEYDLVYGNTHYGALCAILGFFKRIPLVLDMHGGHLEEFLFNTHFDLKTRISPRYLYKYFLCKFQEFLVLRKSNKIICVSHRMFDYLHNKKGISIAKLFYVTNGVDLNFFRPVSEEKIKRLKHQLKLDNKFLFGYIGGYQKWQGVENLITAARMIAEPKCAFIIVGGLRHYNEGNILFVPWLPIVQIPEYYSLCDVLVLPRPKHPATEIAAPTKFAEYAAMGKPILTTEVGDPADLVKKYGCGIVIEDNKPGSLVSGILKFKKMSKAQLKIMGKKARILAEQEFDWDKIAIQLEKVIQSVSS